MSLPVWEEWIEIAALRRYSLHAVSLPVWEEWIEISRARGQPANSCVSSRMGRVD